MGQELPTSPTWQQPGFDLRFAPIAGMIGVAALMGAAREIPGAVEQSVRFATDNNALVLGGVAAAALGAFALARQRFVSSSESLERSFTTVAATSSVMLGGLFAVASKLPGVLHALMVEQSAQGIGLAGAVACYATAFLLTRSNRGRAKMDPYPLAVLKQQESYDYILGQWHPEDWEHAEKGAPEWVTLPEAGTYCSLLMLGLIGSGKTSQLMGSLAIQAMGKFPEDRERQVSLLFIDRKGNQAADVYRWAKELGRENDFRVVRPDIVCDESGEPIIPLNRYASFSPLQGFEEPALLASELQDALESAKERRSPDYFQNVQKEFLTHALTLLLARDERSDLADLHAFAASDEVRKSILSASTDPSLKGATTYFREDFGKLSATDQADLLRGLSSQLTLLTNRAVQKAFCPARPDAHPPLGSWYECLLDRPGIVVFSCPPSLYTKGLSRLLALLVLKSFQQAMERRSDASFAGNKRRPVNLFGDEAHYIFNQTLASFLSVSREANVMNILATQNLSQLPPECREELLSGCRTHVLLASAKDTALEFRDSLGTVSEAVATVSFSEGNRGGGINQDRATASTSRAQSFNQRDRPRFDVNALRHIPLGKGIAHVYDGEKLRPSCMLRTTPWRRLPFYLLDPQKHPVVMCGEGKAHRFKRAKGGTLRCKSCEKTLTNQEASDYRAVLPALRALNLPTTSQSTVDGGTS